MTDVDAALEYMKANGIGGRVTNAVIVAEALTRGIGVSADRRGRVRLSHGGETWLFNNGWSNLNLRLAVRCARQKEVTSRLLRARGAPALENAYFSAQDLDRAWAWAEPVLPVVVKPNDSSHGDSVYLDIAERDSFAAAFTAVGAAHGGVLIEGFTRGAEHRVTTVDGRVVAATRRVPAHVVGDGRRSVSALIAEKNAKRNKNRDRIHRILRLDALAREQLNRQGLTTTSIPAGGQVVRLRATSNISTGGDAIDATDELSAEEKRDVEHAAAALPGARLAGFDVMLPREPGHDPLRILEVNLAPMISMHHFPWEGEPRNVGGAVLDAMFRSAPEPVARLRRGRLVGQRT